MIYLDDGKLGGTITSVSHDVVTVCIDHPAHGADEAWGRTKASYVPDTHLPISAITDKDIADLAAVVELADMIEMSFVRKPEDIEHLLSEQLNRLGDNQLGIVLKIETRQGFENLPELLLTAMRHHRIGVMIARGDLAVECGYERMAELQEEIPMAVRGRALAR